MFDRRARVSDQKADASARMVCMVARAGDPKCGAVVSERKIAEFRAESLVARAGE